MANLLTGLRLLLLFPVAAGFAGPALLPPSLLLGLLLAAIATDFFDGIVARRTGSASPAGQVFDHSTDFLFVTSGLAGAAYAGAVPALLPILIVAAFGQYLLDSRFWYRQKALRMSFIGRWNGILYFAPLLILACARLDMLSAVAPPLQAGARAAAWILVATTVVSIIDRAAAPWRKGSPP